jgi:hypothetical protein
LLLRDFFFFRHRGRARAQVADPFRRVRAERRPSNATQIGDRVIQSTASDAETSDSLRTRGFCEQADAANRNDERAKKRERARFRGADGEK